MYFYAIFVMFLHIFDYFLPQLFALPEPSDPQSMLCRILGSMSKHHKNYKVKVKYATSTEGQAKQPGLPLLHTFGYIPSLSLCNFRGWPLTNWLLGYHMGLTVQEGQIIVAKSSQKCASGRIFPSIPRHLRLSTKSHHF